ETGANLGFAAGANHGAARAQGDVLIFLNPDARVLPGAVQTLADTLRLAPGAGIAGGGLVDGAGRWQPAAARFGPGRHLVLDTTPGRLVARGRRLPHRVEWVYGTFVAIRRDLFRQLAASTPRTSSMARTWICVTARPGSGRAPSWCRPRRRRTART